MSQNDPLVPNWAMKLISHYLLSADRLSRRLSESFRQPDLLTGRRSNAIPRAGRSADGLEFRFHGAGCWMCDDEVSVDVDFTPEGGVDGFDAWRLHVYSSDNPEIVGYRSQGELQTCLSHLAEQGLITQVLGSRLYRIKTGTLGVS